MMPISDDELRVLIAAVSPRALRPNLTDISDQRMEMLRQQLRDRLYEGRYVVFEHAPTSPSYLTNYRTGA